jgi:Zn-dependent metalloprotease
MRTIKFSFLLLFVIAGNSLNAQLSTDSIQYGWDKSIPSVVFLSQQQKSVLISQTKKLDDIAKAEKAVRSALPIEKDVTLKLQDKIVDFNDNADISFYQYYKGLRVGKKRCVVHYKGENADHITGDLRTIGNLSVRPQLSESEALQRAISYTGAEKYIWEEEQSELAIKKIKNDPAATRYPKGELIIYFNKQDLPVLVYEFVIEAVKPFSAEYVYVNATNGEVEGTRAAVYDVQGTAATRYSGTRNIETQSVTGGYRLYDSSRGGITTYNGTNGVSDTNYIDNDNNWTSSEWDNANKDNAALDVHWGAMMTYDYFKNKFDRNSYDNQNSPIIAYVNIPDTNITANWNTSLKYIQYGIYEEENPYPSLDVVAHEITHGVTQFMAGLVYEGESGALNESISDIFATCVEQYYKLDAINNWIMCEQIMTGGRRHLNNPNAKGHPDTYMGTYWANTANIGNDHGGVHTNSGVMNHWFYVLVNGKSGTNDNGTVYSVQGIGIDKAAKIVYETLDNLSPSSNYFDACRQSVIAAQAVYGNNSNEAKQVLNAWHAVGVLIVTGAVSTPNVTNVTYTVLTKPTNATITWSSSSNLSLSGANGTTSNTATFSVITTGDAWVQATVIANGVSYTLPRKDISISSFRCVNAGTENPLQATNTLSSSSQVTVSQTSVPANTTYAWSLISGSPTSWSQNTSTGQLLFKPSGYNTSYTFKLSATSAGYTATAQYLFTVSSGTITYVGYNQETGTLDIQFTDKQSTVMDANRKPGPYIIRLVDLYGMVAKEGKSDGEDIHWNLSGLENKVYVVQIIDQRTNTVIETRKILKNK